MEGIIQLDLHGKNLYQARVSIDSALKRANGSVYRLRLIHGHWGGTALREMIGSDYGRHPRVKRLLRSPDGGSTDLILREF